ncbi:MAG: M61 family peptidase [Planctomycetota bacterium]|nr:MAG: M61 family peptidase [Planctomycetota bacterium]
MTPVRYDVSLAGHRQHMLEIRLRCAAPQGALRFGMPAWTPGSYKIREYARVIERVQARAGERSLAVRKLDKQRWELAGAEGGEIELRYRVYANEPSVRTPAVDDVRALLHGAGVFVFVEGQEERPHEVRLTDLPEGWEVATALEPIDGDESAHRFAASDYDALIDAPILCGRLRTTDFEHAGVPHRIAASGPARGFDLEAARTGIERIVAAAGRLWGGLPYRRFVFLVLREPGVRGGLEHRDSTVLGAPPFGLSEPERWRDWLVLAAHEHFHAWNGKRLRPEGLGPFELARERHTDALWAVEGITSYYERIVARRAEVLSAEQLMDGLATLIDRVHSTPGRRVRSLAEASFDTWTTFYIRDEHTPNRTVSYYDKGALVTWALDLEIRRRTGGERSFDDVLRAMWRRFPPEAPRGYRSAELEEEIDRVAGGGLRPLLEAWIRGTEDPDWQPLLAPFGMRLERSESGERAWLGVKASGDGARIATVYADGPAWRAGLSGGDEPVALDGYRVRAAELAARLEDYEPGERCTLTVLRGDRLLEIAVTLGARPRGELRLRRREDAEPEARARWERWACAPWPE